MPSWATPPAALAAVVSRSPPLGGSTGRVAAGSFSRVGGDWVRLGAADAAFGLAALLAFGAAAAFGFDAAAFGFDAAAALVACGRPAPRPAGARREGRFGAAAGFAPAALGDASAAPLLVARLVLRRCGRLRGRLDRTSRSFESAMCGFKRKTATGVT
jgi:hypothetical protein